MFRVNFRYYMNFVVFDNNVIIIYFFDIENYLNRLRLIEI